MYTIYPIVARACPSARASKGILHTTVTPTQTLTPKTNLNPILTQTLTLTHTLTLILTLTPNPDLKGASGLHEDFLKIDIFVSHREAL